MIEHLLCDFDGTLVDSADGILASLRHCIASAGVKCRIEPSRELLHCPLPRLIEAVVSSEDPAVLDDIAARFRREYDTWGYRSTRPFPGVPEVLRRLSTANVRVHLVTNKRMTPTRQILTFLGWQSSFATVNTLDTAAPAVAKAGVVANLLRRLGVDASVVAMVGDSADDEAAAAQNRVEFGAAGWGYGLESLSGGDYHRLEAPGDLIPMIGLTSTV